MRQTISIALIAAFLLPAMGICQLTGSISNTADNVRELYIPYHKPPPTIYYVPNEMVIALQNGIQPTTADEAADIVATGNTEIDELNKIYGVTRFERQFPDMPHPVAEADLSAGPEGFGLDRYYVLKFDDAHDLRKVMEAYASCSAVELVEPIGVHPVYERIPDDPYFLSDQWNFYDPDDHDVDATDVWDHETGDASVILADLDTGLQYNSRDLGGLSPYTDGNVWINWVEYNGSPGVDDDGNGYVDDWVGWDFVDNAYNPWPGEDGDTPDNEPTDFNGHGTHVAGIMGAITNNGYAVAGLAGGWNADNNDPANGVKIMACRIGWSSNWYGQEVGYVRMDFAASAIYYAVNNGAVAINCSWGSSNTGGLGAAVDYAVANDVFFSVATGNDNSTVPDYLGTRTDVMDVCATDDDDRRASFSNYGTWVDVAAPGVDILSTFSYHYNPGYVAWMSGTSQAAPHVTGEAGLLKSHNPALTRQEITDIIVNTADYIDDLNPGYEGLLGSGRINVYKAVDAVYVPEVTVIYPNGGEVFYIGTVETLLWDASDNIGIETTVIEYSVDGGGSWMLIDTVAGNPGSYDWTVTGPPSSTCRIGITCIDAVGGEGWDMSDEDFCPPYKRTTNIDGFGIAGADGVPSYYALHQNSPNPFNPTTEISFSLPQPSHVNLTVYNVAGQAVATPVSGYMEAGEHTVVWDSRDGHGRRVASGVYFYRIQADDFAATRKMVLLK